MLSSAHATIYSSGPFPLPAAAANFADQVRSQNEYAPITVLPGASIAVHSPKRC